MENIIEVLKASDDLSAGKGASAEQIDAASKSLGLAFAEDYLMYLEEFGLAYVNGHELTGIGVIPRNDVVSVTLEKRKLPYVEEIPADWYVIEDTNIDSIRNYQIIWQEWESTLKSHSKQCLLNHTKEILNILLPNTS